MNWTAKIDAYCERVDPSFWGEPLNAISNLGFVLVGIFWCYKGVRAGSLWTESVSVIAILVGIGSFLFHTYANVWSMWADILPIMVFMTLMFYFILSKVFGLSWFLSLSGTLGFVALGFLARFLLPKGFLNGAGMYMHGVATLLICSFILWRRKAIGAKELSISSLLFLVSLTFRTLDPVICESLPIGSHFLWHGVNAVLIYVLIRLVFRFHTIKLGPKS